METIACKSCDGTGQNAKHGPLVSQQAPQKSEALETERDRCPHCTDGVNSPERDGTDRCFHCGSCSYIGCMWTDSEKREMLAQLVSQSQALEPVKREFVADADEQGCCCRECCSYCAAKADARRDENQKVDWLAHALLLALIVLIAVTCWSLAGAR